MELKGTIKNREAITHKPNLIKADSSLLGLGIMKTPPRVDCRVVAEAVYADMNLAYNVAPELLEVAERVDYYFRWLDQEDIEAPDYTQGDLMEELTKAINKALIN